VSDESDEKNFEQEHGVDIIYLPHHKQDKVIITVFDTGIGIKAKDKIKLFKLFGCLQNTMQMNI
jgi:signal transduction histidine kinase